MGESILGVAVGTGAGRLDLNIKQRNIPLNFASRHLSLKARCMAIFFTLCLLPKLLKQECLTGSCIIQSDLWRRFVAPGCLLHHGEREFAGGGFDLVLGLQVRHPLSADPINC